MSDQMNHVDLPADLVRLRDETQAGMRERQRNYLHYLQGLEESLDEAMADEVTAVSLGDDDDLLKAMELIVQARQAQQRVLRKAVARLVLDHGHSRRSVAHHIGVSPAALGEWLPRFPSR